MSHLPSPPPSSSDVVDSSFTAAVILEEESSPASREITHREDDENSPTTTDLPNGVDRPPSPHPHVNGHGGHVRHRAHHVPPDPASTRAAPLQAVEDLPSARTTSAHVRHRRKEVRLDVNGFTSTPGEPEGARSGPVPYSAYDPYATPTDDRFPRRESFPERRSDTGQPRLSRPVELIRTAYDVVVIGSGYGGGVAASRMSRGAQSVCIFERGKERWPGEYPSTFTKASDLLHVSGLCAPWNSPGKFIPDTGDPTEMYHLILGNGQNVFVANGLGGTSLLNANVFLEADERTLQLDAWPEEIRNNPGELRKYYERAESVLEPTEYPLDYPALAKLEMLERQSVALGFSDKFRRVRQTTRFVDGPNSTGVQMRASTLSGQDTTGVNDGSKSSTLVNYISDAWNWGAEIFCQCEVRYVTKHPTEEGYLVYFAWHGSSRGSFKTNLYEDLMWVHAKKFVFFGAGAIGTTEILLRSKAHGLDMSSMIGKHMSGNGDILAFGYDTDCVVNPMGREIPKQKQPIGPTITGIIDCRDQVHTRDGYVIEEGAIPSALAPLFQLMIEATLGKVLPTNLTIIQKATHFVSRVASTLIGPYFPKGSIEKTQIYLVMSHDAGQASLRLKGEKPELDWVGVGRSERVAELHKLLEQATSVVGGTYVDSPFYANFGQQEISVHPIGGAIMSFDGTGINGVVNHQGQVLRGQKTDAHPGLVCVDASVIPTALGANPFATITALAERTVEKIAEENGINIDYEADNGLLDLIHPAHRIEYSAKVDRAELAIRQAKADGRKGFLFSEVMAGYIHMGDEISDYELAYQTARGRCEAARFFLSVRSWDVDKMVHANGHHGLLTGTVACSLPGGPFLVTQGDFSLFNQDRTSAETKNLTYDFDMVSTRGDVYHFHGYKIVNTSVAFDPLALWRSTTTLYVTLKKGGHDGPVCGKGMMHISPKDFASELVSMSPTATNTRGRIAAASKFLGYFTRQSASLFFAPFTHLLYPTNTYSGYIDTIHPDHTVSVRATDGVPSVVHMWEPDPRATDGQPVKTIFMIPGAAVDHQIFALPTIPWNAVKYFRKAGYRLYTVTHRIGMNPSNEKLSPTTFDARLDVAAAIQYIWEKEKHNKFYVIAHCMGSVALSCGLLDGTIPKEYIAGLTCSQTFMNPVWSTLNMIKTMAPIPLDKVYRKLVGTWFPCSSRPGDHFIQQVINQILRLYPVGSRSELCSSVVCHRCSFVFGRCWNHENLNEDTHSQLDRFFSGVNTNFEAHAEYFGDKGAACTNPPLFVDLVTARNLQRIEGIPIMLFSGADNKVLSPESTDKTLEALQSQFPNGNYERYVIPNYGHLDSWMGKNAYRDVYPLVRRHADKIMFGESRIDPVRSQGQAA